MINNKINFQELTEEKKDMTFEEAKALARQGIKMTHEYFMPEEYITMQGNMIIFEDNVKIFADEWSKGKNYLLNGWKRFE